MMFGQRHEGSEGASQEDVVGKRKGKVPWGRAAGRMREQGGEW